MRNRATIAAAILGLALSSGCSVGWRSPNASILSVTMTDVETGQAESVLVQTEAGGAGAGGSAASGAEA